VFINCPFDSAYWPRFWSIVFAVMDAGLQPRSALDIDDAATGRLNRIADAIKDCRYSIHDLCRADDPRFNMPFEAGLAMGLAKYGRAPKHRILVLATNKKKFDKACSDMRGVDPKFYRTYPHRQVTTWLQTLFDPKVYVPSPKETAQRFGRFWRGLPEF